MTTAIPLPNSLILDRQKRLSDSLIWGYQRTYFDKQGINAWVNQVPFYVTSNPFIATSYAKIVLRFIQDWVRQHPDSKKHPFYILELGTGSGRFSFYVLKALHELLESYGLADCKIQYVMTDVTRPNLAFYQTHHALKPYLDKGLVDFAYYDMEKEEPIQLINSGIELTPEILINPLTVFANYIFDTVSQDIFSVKQGKLSEVRVSLSTGKNNFKENQPIDFKQINFAYSKNEINPDYYADPHLNALLKGYQDKLQDSYFLLPIGSIRALNWLKQLANQKLFLIATDKGHFTLNQLENLGHPAIAFHGSFSMTVNFHAISEYIKRNQGEFYSQAARSNIQTCAASIGFSLDNFLETKMIIQESIRGFSPSDYFNLHKHMYEAVSTCDIPTLASYLLLSLWDPHIFLKMSNQISELAEKNNGSALRYLVDHLAEVAKNYYYMPNTECVLFEIGVIFHSLKRYQEALTYYNQAETFVGEQFGVHYNSALCLFHLKQHQESLVRLERALKIEPDSKEVKEWIIYIKKLIKEKNG